MSYQQEACLQQNTMVVQACLLFLSKQSKAPPQQGGPSMYTDS